MQLQVRIKCRNVLVSDIVTEGNQALSGLHAVSCDCFISRSSDLRSSLSRREEAERLKRRRTKSADS